MMLLRSLESTQEATDIELLEASLRATPTR